MPRLVSSHLFILLQTIISVIMIIIITTVIVFEKISHFRQMLFLSLLSWGIFLLGYKIMITGFIRTGFKFPEGSYVAWGIKKNKIILFQSQSITGCPGFLSS